MKGVFCQLLEWWLVLREFGIAAYIYNQSTLGVVVRATNRVRGFYLGDFGRSVQLSRL